MGIGVSFIIVQQRRVACLRCEFPKMNLIEDDLVRMADSPESRDKGSNGEGNKHELVIPFGTLLLLDLPNDLVNDNLVVAVCCAINSLLFRGSLADRACGCGHCEQSNDCSG
jgi:hypothetical protein